MPDKNDIALILARAHRSVEPTITRIIRLVSSVEDDPREPIKLLEVNPATSPSGILPIAFAADPPSVPFPSVVVEVTENEFLRIGSGMLVLPSGWQLGDTLYSAA